MGVDKACNELLQLGGREMNDLLTAETETITEPNVVWSKFLYQDKQPIYDKFTGRLRFDATRMYAPSLDARESWLGSREGLEI